MQHKRISLFAATVLAAVALGLGANTAWAAAFDGQADNGTDALGYYYAITGGKTGANAPVTIDGQSYQINGAADDSPLGGAFRFVADDYGIWGRSETDGQWAKDNWFSENAGLALTLKSGATTVYDNNGIEDGTYGNYYSALAQGTTADDTPGMHKAYSMSNNFDWIYAGYFSIASATTFDTIIGYFDEDTGFDPNNPNVSFRVNIFSNVDSGLTFSTAAGDDLTPTNTGGFDGDVLSSDNAQGSFTVSDSGIDRVYPDTSTQDIMRLTYTLDSPVTLQPGVYWFSHDAVIPEPTSLALIGLGGLMMLPRRKRRRAEGKVG